MVGWIIFWEGDGLSSGFRLPYQFCYTHIHYFNSYRNCRVFSIQIYQLYAYHSFWAWVTGSLLWVCFSSGSENTAPYPREVKWYSPLCAHPSSAAPHHFLCVVCPLLLLYLSLLCYCVLSTLLSFPVLVVKNVLIVISVAFSPNLQIHCRLRVTLGTFCSAWYCLAQYIVLFIFVITICQ